MTFHLYWVPGDILQCHLVLFSWTRSRYTSFSNILIHMMFLTKPIEQKKTNKNLPCQFFTELYGHQPQMCKNISNFRTAHQASHDLPIWKVIRERSLFTAGGGGTIIIFGWDLMPVYSVRPTVCNCVFNVRWPLWIRLCNIMRHSDAAKHHVMTQQCWVD